MTTSDTLKRMFLLVTVALISACGADTDDDDDKDTDDFAQILPVIDAATPPALKVTTAASALRRQSRQEGGRSFSARATGDDDAVKAGIEYLFDTTYTNISGDSVQGFFRSAISVIDKRANEEGTGMLSSGGDKCRDGADYTPAITALATANNLTLQPACTKLFNPAAASEQSALGSGYSFGETTESDGKVTMTSWLTLVQENAIDKFAMLGKITNATATTESEKGAEVMFLEAGPAGGGWLRYTLYHIIAKPADQQYEFSLVSTSPGVMQAPTATTDVTGFGCGIQMVYDGTYIRAKGSQLLTGTDCTSAVAFDVCLKAEDMTVEADATCTSMTFTMSAMAPTLFDTTTKAEIEAALMVAAATEANTLSD